MFLCDLTYAGGAPARSLRLWWEGPRFRSSSSGWRTAAPQDDKALDVILIRLLAEKNLVQVPRKVNR